MSSALQKMLEERAAQAKATMSAVETGMESSMANVNPTEGAVLGTTLSEEEAKAAFADEELPENTYFLLGDTRQLLMPSAKYLKGDARNLVHSDDPRFVARLDYYASKGLCLKLA